MIKLSFWQRSWLIALLLHSLGLYLLCRNLTKEQVKLSNVKNYRYVNLVKMPIKNESINSIKKVKVEVDNKMQVKNAGISKVKKNVGINNNFSNKMLVNSKAEHGKVTSEKKDQTTFFKDKFLSKQNLVNEQSDNSILKKVGDNADIIGNFLGRTSDEQLYETQIIKVIMQHWIKPLQLSKQDFCIWKINLSLKGEVIKMELVSSSNNENLEISSQEAIYAAQPFLLPDDEKEATNFLELKITFKDD